MSNCVILPLDFPTLFSFIINGFIKIHGYSNKIPFICDHKIKNTQS